MRRGSGVCRLGPGRLRTLLALTLLLGGCRPSPLDLDIIVPVASEPMLAEVTCYRLEAHRGDEVWLDAAADPFDLHLDAMPLGTYDLDLLASDGKLEDGCLPGDIRARAKTFGVHITADRERRVPLLLLPVDRPIALDVPEWVERWFAGRTGLAAAVAVDATGVPRVLFAGGLVDGEPSAEVIRYEPREARFTALPDLACARVGAAAVVVGAPGESESVLIAATRSADDDRACSVTPDPEDELPLTAMGTAELLDPARGSTTLERLALPVAQPRAARNGAEVWLLGDPSSEAPIFQRYAPDEVAGDGAAWRRDPRNELLLPETGGAFTSILPESAPPFLVAGGSVAGERLNVLSLLEPAPDEPQLVECARSRAPLVGENLVATPTGSGEVLFAGGERDASSSWVRQTFDGGSSCGADPGSRTGSLGTPRSALLASPLGGGRVLLSGGDLDDTPHDPNGTPYSMEVYLPQLGNTLPLGEGSGVRGEHVAVLLEDGSVLLAGGNETGTVDALLATTTNVGRLHWDHVIDPAPPLDVLVVVSSHADAREVRRLLREGDRDGPKGLAAAIRPLVNAFEITNDAEIEVVVTTGDRRCEDGAQGTGGQPLGCDEDAADKVAELNCKLDAIDAHDEAGACVAQELLLSLQDAIVALDPPERGVPDRPLVVLVVAPRDDCSSATGDVFEDDGLESLERRCSHAEDLLDPTAIADTLATLRGGDPRLISVMTFGGPEVAPADPDQPACEGVWATPRLAELSRAMGPRGHHVDLCEDIDDFQAIPGAPLRTPLDWFSTLVEGRIGRTVCLPHRPAGESCVVTYDEEVEGALRAVRVDWTVTSDPDTCSALAVSPSFDLPIGTPVAYACQ